MKYSLKIDSENCKGCRLCIRECPKDLLQIAEKFNKKGWQYVEFNFKDPCIRL